MLCFVFLLQFSHRLLGSHNIIGCHRLSRLFMQAIYFTSFGLLVSLLLKQQRRKSFKISSAEVTLIINPTLPNEDPFTPDKKNKKKKNKKGAKPQMREVCVRDQRRDSRREQQLESEQKREADRKMRCQWVGNELEGLKSIFPDQLQALAHYNGTRGHYKLIIPIPGTNYSEIPITIQLNQNYPFQLPQVSVQTHNLHPLEKQKLNSYISQQQGLFLTHQSHFADREEPKKAQVITEQLPNSRISKSNGRSVINNTAENGSSRITHNDWLLDGCTGLSIRQSEEQAYLQSYYPYLLNLFAGIPMELFSRIQQQSDTTTAMMVSTESRPACERGNAEQRMKRKQQTKKQILANMLEQIFYEYEEENNRNNKSFMGQPNHHQDESSMVKKQALAQQNHHSRGRYIIDYEELEKIGEGGFGRVYKCRNRVDSNIYAVKKMVINYNDPQSRKLLKEVSLLSKLNHPNIVRYHQSWLEDTMSVDELIADMSVTDTSEVEEFNNIWNQYRREHRREDESSNQLPDDDNDESVIFGDDIIYDEEAGDSDGVFVQDSPDNSSFCKKSSFSSRKQSSSSYSRKQSGKMEKEKMKPAQVEEFPFKILYIVMEYCGGMTLRDYISQQFHQPSELKIKIIRGMLEGLSYIHSRRIIHRDLKPANIFLIEKSNKVKIGDFGLATVGNIENNPYEAEIIEYSEKTKGVGTTFYRAPEQLRSSHYDEKIDIYSLGIIMLEMFYQFETNMERHETLNEVTRTYRLPKDFNKNEQYIEHAELIESCLSSRSEDRPSVHKLLETFRNKYFTQLVSVIANPKHFQFYQLVNHLFRIKNDSSSVMKQSLHKNYLTNEFIRIYQSHRGIMFTPLSLIPAIDYETFNGAKVPVSRKEKYLLLSERGVVLEYPSNTYSTWIRYAKQTMRRTKKGETEKEMRGERYFEVSSEIRRFTFEKVAEFMGGDVKTEFSFKEKYVTAFDITYSLDEGEQPAFLCQILQMSLTMVRTMDLTQKRPYINMCHSLLFTVLANCWKANPMHLSTFLLSITDEKFRSLKNSGKLDLLQKHKIETNFGKKLINFMQMEFEDSHHFLEECGKIEGKNVSAQMQAIEESIRELEDELRIFGLHEDIRWKLMIPSSFCQGFYWNIGPVKGFTSVEEYLPGCDMCNLHIETPINLGSDENPADVSIWSNGEYLKKDILEIVAKCWEYNVTVKWYDQSLGEKDLSCRNNIILKKKLDRVYLMIRKNNQHGHNHSLGLGDKKHSEDDREGSFIPKDFFNFQVLANLSSRGKSTTHH